MQALGLLDLNSTAMHLQPTPPNCPHPTNPLPCKPRHGRAQHTNGSPEQGQLVTRIRTLVTRYYKHLPHVFYWPPSAGGSMLAYSRPDRCPMNLLAHISCLGLRSSPCFRKVGAGRQTAHSPTRTPARRVARGSKRSFSVPIRQSTNTQTGHFKTGLHTNTNTVTAPSGIGFTILRGFPNKDRPCSSFATNAKVFTFIKGLSRLTLLDPTLSCVTPFGRPAGSHGWPTASTQSTSFQFTQQSSEKRLFHLHPTLHHHSASDTPTTTCTLTTFTNPTRDAAWSRPC